MKVEEPTAFGMTRNEWVKYYMSLAPCQRRKLDRLINGFSQANQIRGEEASS